MTAPTGHKGPFPTTSWSALRQLRDRQSPDYARHLEQLAAAYWKPIYCVIRYGWSRSQDDARDLTQDFFATRLMDGLFFDRVDADRGSFRGYLKGAIGHFMMNVIRAAGQQKRGGGLRTISLEGEAPSLADLYPDRPEASPDEIFDAAWRALVMGRALERAEEQLRAAGRGEAFDAFRRYDLAELDPAQSEPQDEATSYESLAAELGWTPRKLKRALMQARAAFRDAIADVVREYVDGPEALEREMRALLPG